MKKTFNFVVVLLIKETGSLASIQRQAFRKTIRSLRLFIHRGCSVLNSVTICNDFVHRCAKKINTLNSDRHSFIQFIDFPAYIVLDVIFKKEESNKTSIKN